MGEDVGRHDFYAGVVEVVEDVLVQLGINGRQQFGLVGITIDFVLDVEVVKGGDNDERLRLLDDVRRSLGSG